MSATFVLVAGTTETARIPGLSAAGASPALVDHTPSIDAELVTFGRPRSTDRVPVSPTGCATPAVVTRAALERHPVEVVIVDGGLAVSTSAPTRSIGAPPGGDLRSPSPVPSAEAIAAAGRSLVASLPGAPLVIGESIPGGTTTALGVLTALGEPEMVSSSLATNPLERKRAVVAAGLEASGLGRGSLKGHPIEAIARMGDPVMATVTGMVMGALEADRPVTLAGGTQMLAIAAAVRHAGVTGGLRVATTTFVAADPTVDLPAAADRYDVDLGIVDPEFDRATHPAVAGYPDGEAKEGVGMGGILDLVFRAGVTPADVKVQIETVADRIGIGHTA